MGESIAGYAASLPITPKEGSPYSLTELLQDILDHGKAHFTSNMVFVPVLQTLNVLLSSEKLQDMLSGKDMSNQWVSRWHDLRVLM